MCDRLLLCIKGWEVVIIVNTTSYWSSYSIVKIILIGFLTDFLYVKILVLCRGVSLFFFSCESETAM